MIRGSALFIAVAVIAVAATRSSRPALTLTGSGASVSSVAFSPDGRILATDDAGPWTYLWTLATGQRTALPSGSDSDGGGSLAFSPDGRSLAVAEGGVYAGSAVVWDIATGTLMARFSDPSGYAITSVAFSPDGKALAGGDNYDANQPATIPARTYVWDVGGLP